jgi:hypothetical protein
MKKNLFGLVKGYKIAYFFIFYNFRVEAGMRTQNTTAFAWRRQSLRSGREWTPPGRIAFYNRRMQSISVEPF